MSSPIDKMIAAQKQGMPVGLFSVCSANPVVIETAVKFAAERQIPLIVESTCNQVNQYGGYTGLLPGQFAEQVWKLVERYELPNENLVLGGDHLGPYPWHREPADAAMQKARQMVHDYVAAGYQKIHLDASMRCADDDPDLPLDVAVVADRASALCAAAEDAAARLGTSTPISYVIGSEVPLPGGADSIDQQIQVTRVADVQETIRSAKNAFDSHRLEDAWERVIAVVVQPGVEFGDSHVDAYQPEAAGELSRFIKSDPQKVFEAHSTDYQTSDALKRLVEDQFAILKVGPELTFAYREAMFLLEMIEIELTGDLAGSQLSNLRGVLDSVMVAKPMYWKNYYPGTWQEQAFARKYSFSDRIRYYWPEPEVQASISRLFSNLRKVQFPDALIRQFFPCQNQKIQQTGAGAASPLGLVEGKIREVLEKYAEACAGANKLWLDD